MAAREGDKQQDWKQIVITPGGTRQCPPLAANVNTNKPVNKLRSCNRQFFPCKLNFVFI